MAEKKNDKKTGFAAPAIGEALPKGVKLRNNPDGTVTIVYPKKKDGNGKKK